jgi:signal transduction histidine kinase
MPVGKLRYSLRRSLVVPAVALLLALSLGLVAVGHWAGKRIVYAMSEQLILHMTAAIEDHVTFMMDVPPRMLARVQNAIYRRHIPLDDPQAVAKELYTQLQGEPGVDWLYFVNDAGGLVSVGRLEDGVPVFLMTDNFRAGPVREYLASPDGTPATLRRSGGYFDARIKAWYKTAKETRRSIWTKPYQGAVEQIYGISISAPAVGKNAEMLGVLGLDLILTRLSEFMNRQRLGEKGRAFLVDEDGYLIASSGGVLPVKIDPTGRQQRLRPDDVDDPVVRAAGRHVAKHPEIVKRSRKGVQPFMFDDRKLGRVSAAVDSFPLSDGTFWLIISAVPTSEFLSAIRYAGYLSLILLVLLLGVSIAFGVWTVNRVLQPVDALTNAAYEIGEGKWPEIPETDREDEIGVLARALQNMTRTLKGAQEELEHRVVHRTAELTNTIGRLREEIEERERITQALEAETAVRLRVQSELHAKDLLLLQQSRLAAMGEMIGNIAHQWRQPLNMLGLLVQELPVTYKRGGFSGDYLDASVKKMLDTIRYMSKTIDDFREFSRADKERVDFRMVEMVEKTISLLQGSLNAHLIKTSVVAEGDPVVNGYPNEFSQALLNIMINARDALVSREAPAPLITVTVGMDGGTCVVTVSDNAGGIRAEIIDKIFDPYFTTKGPEQGTGIGLYMAKLIIEKNMGGRITVRNTGEGAEFRIEI